MHNADYSIIEPLAFGPVVGFFLDREIHEWVEMTDGKYRFGGRAPGPKPGLVNLDLLDKDDICIAPGLLYRRIQRNA